MAQVSEVLRPGHGQDKISKLLVYFDGQFVPSPDAQINVRTSAFNYGTGVFEGIRAYWNEEQKQLFIVKLEAHYQRLLDSSRIMKIKLPADTKELSRITLELVRKNNHREDIYIRPLAFKSSQALGPRLHDLEDSFVIYTLPFGDYLDVDAGIKVGVSSWKRLDDNMIPARAKITGAYVNTALAKTEALENGFDEAIMLTDDGHISEGSAENFFMVKDGVLITTLVSDNILVGITRNAIIDLARDEFGLTAIERPIDRTELYTADECFLCGTGAQVSPVTEADYRIIGDGKVGPITAKLQELYFDIVRGKVDKYTNWLTPVY